MSSKFLFAIFVILNVESLQGKTVNRKPQRLQHRTKCTYDYEVTVYTARGDKSTQSDGYQVHTLVDLTPVSCDFNGRQHSYLIKLDVREPRLRRVHQGRILVNHPVNEEFEEQLSKPFYFQQEDHGTITDILFAKRSESPEIAAFKKGIAGGFQLNLKEVHRSNFYEVLENDDSGIFRTKYSVISANETHTHLHRSWTNQDYQTFADGTPASAEHKVQSQHNAYIHLKEGKVERVHRTNRAFFRPTNGHPRADNFEGFKGQEQDIEMSTKGYSRLTLRSCQGPEHHRSKRLASEEQHLKIAGTLNKDNILFTDTEKIKWSKIGREKKTPRSFYEVLRCFTDKSMKERQIADCSNEMHRMVREDGETFRKLKRLVRNRSHQNITSWTIYIAALAGSGNYDAQNTLAEAVKGDYPRTLSKEEYKTFLIGIFYLPEGPLHSQLFDALFNLVSREEKGDEVTSTAMLVLAGLAERARRSGYNESLCDSVAEMIHSRYKNRSTLYHPDSLDHEMQLRDHIWAFGNLGHHSGLPVILKHIDHDNSGIRSAVISAMRKLLPEHTNQHLMQALYVDEHPDVKAAVVDILVERHQNLSDSVVQGLERALWHAKESETLDSSIIQLIENHGDHPKAVYLRKRRDAIHREKRALFSFLRPREFALGPSQRWQKTYGGSWVGAESVIQFINQVKLRIGIFGGKFEIDLDNQAYIQGHILKFGFEVVRGKAVFKASASFKNDFPKDLIHTIADVGDNLLRKFDSITSVIAEQINQVIRKLKGYLPLNIDKFLDFIKKLVQFLQNLVQPLKSINLIGKVINLSKDVSSRLKDWKWLTEMIKKIQYSRRRLTGVDDVFKNVIAALDKILDIVGSITKYLPHNLPVEFNILKLLDILRSVSGDLHFDKMKEYFNSLGFSVPDGFRLQFPFKFSIRLLFSLETFQQVPMKLLRFANHFLDVSSLLDILRSIRFPRLHLPDMNQRFPSFKESGFNFGLPFNWRISLKFNLNLKSPSFQKFISILQKLGDFLEQFRLPGFDLGTFFEEILPGKIFDLGAFYKDLFDGSADSNSENPSDVLQEFLEKLVRMLDFQSGNVLAIGDITDFFHELGLGITDFADKNVKHICEVSKVAFNSSREFKEFGVSVEMEGMKLLQAVENTTKNAFTELLNFTVLLDSLTDQIQRNVTTAAKEFVTESLQGLTTKLKYIQNLKDDLVDFANGTASKVNGACTKAAIFSADVIDKVQENAREALLELGSFTGPVATKIKTVGRDLKYAVSNVEKWYEENMAARVGKISRVAQIVSDFLSVLNSKKGFLKSVREIAVQINEALRRLQNLPEYANKARKTVDDVLNFADRAQNYKKEIQKLDIRKQFGLAFDQRIQDVCNEFKTITAETLDKFGNYDIVKEVETFFKKEVDKLVRKAVSKFSRIKEPINEMQEELRNIKAMVREVMGILIEFKPFTNSFLPILETVGKLPECKKIKKILVESTEACVHKAFEVGRYVIYQYNDLKKEVKVLYDMVPATWKNFKIQKCIKGGACISKAFIDQAKTIKDKVDVLKDKFKKASGYSDTLETCKRGVDNITAVIDTVQLLVEQVQNLSVKDDLQRVKSILLKLTGRNPEGNGESVVHRRSITYVKERIERIVDYVQMTKAVQRKLEEFLKNAFQAMRNVYDDAVLEHIKAVRDVRSKLQLSYEFWKKTNNANNVLQALDTATQGAMQYAENSEGVKNLISGPIIYLLSETEELDNVVKPYLDKYAPKFTNTVTVVNSFLDKVTDFLNKLQLRQRGLDLRAYKPWNQIPYCSEEVCVRSIKRSSSLYLETIFTWKFPHLDDLSSMEKSGRWLTPGLFDDYKVEGISRLSNSEVILGMHGVSSNKGKASLLVVTGFGRGVKKIIQLRSKGNPLAVKIGGVAVSRDYIWISDSTSKKIHQVKKSSVTRSFSSKKPSWIEVAKTLSVEGTATSVSHDELTNVLWVTDSKGEKAYGYKLLSDGDLFSPGLTPDRVIVIGANAQGMAIVRQFSTEYVCISKCAMISGFQCKLEFHDISGGDEIGKKKPSRVIRTPSGLQSVTSVDKEVIAVAFSSGTYAEKENVELIGGDFEERYFYLRLPILKTTFGIHENCLFFSVMKDYIIRPRKLIPIGDMVCGTTRKRSTSQELLESDVYSEKLEEIHLRNRRIRRQASDPGSCSILFRGNALRGYQEFLPEYSQTIIVFGIPVRLFAGAGGYYSVDYQGQVCFKDKVFRLGLIPGAWVSVYAGAALSAFVVEAGITIEARILETYLIPDLSIRIDKWPLKACIELKMRMTPLRIRVSLWYRLRLCFRVKCWLIGCRVNDGWCGRNTIWEWWWSAKTIDRTLFTNCRQDIDKTPPIAGTCTARQAADKKYFVQWHGFHEDTEIKNYHVRIGSIQGSGDDYSAWVGTSLSVVVDDLPIMHGRDVYVSLLATNDMGRDSKLVNCPKFTARRKGPQIRYVYDGVNEHQDLDYQSDSFALGMNFAIKSDIDDIAYLRWGVSSSSSCTLNEAEADVFPLTPLGDSTTIQTSNLDLHHGRKYFTRIYAMDSIGLKVVMCSNGIVIDRTPPLPGHFQDGAGESDAMFIPSLRRIRGKFDPFKDLESPMVRYDWKISRNNTNEDVTSFVEIAFTQQTPLMDGLSLEAGFPYKLVLRGTNAAGLQTIITSNGFVPDNTPPHCANKAIDVTDDEDIFDVDFVGKLSGIQAKWKCLDQESGIRTQLVGVGTYPGGDDVRTFEDVTFVTHKVFQDGMVFASFSDVSILPRVRYHTTIKIINGANLKKTITSDGIIIDNTPPTVASQYIKDGVEGKDKNYTSERYTFSAHWEQAFADSESGIVEYSVALGTDPGLDDIQNFKTVGSQTEVTFSGLLLSSGQRYFVTVVGCNGIAMCINGSSNGAIVDFVPPHTGKVITGLTGPPLLYQWVTKSVWARWNWCVADEKRASGPLDSNQCRNDSFYDVHSGVAGFGISVASLRNDDVSAAFKKAGRVRSTGRNIDLEDGVYSIVIEAKDKAGVVARGLSNTFIVDSSPPLVTNVQHGHFGETLSAINKLRITFRAYVEIEDDLSQVKTYKVGVGSYPGADDVLKFESISLSTPVSSLRANWTASNVLSVENNRRYFITIWAINSAGLFRIKSSPPLLSDHDTPKSGIVLDGWGSADAQYQSYSTLFRAHWYGFTDFSGVETVLLGLSSKPDSVSCDVQKEEIVPSNRNYYLLFGLNLTSGQKYYACLKMIDRAGNQAVFHSNGVIVDGTPPLPGSVTDGKPGKEIDAQVESSFLQASWFNFTEHETKILTYHLAFGTSPGAQDTQPFIDVGLINTASSSRLQVAQLTSGMRYYATVIAFNLLGMPSALVSSKGVLVDFTPPVFSKPLSDGDRLNEDLSSTTGGSLAATWTCNDPETSLASIQIAFGSQPGEVDVMKFTSLPIYKTSFKVERHLQLGYRYFATVKCTNNVGLKATAVSNGIVFDDTQPDLIYINDGKYQVSLRNLTVKFKFVDAESGVKEYKVIVWRRIYLGSAKDIYGFFSFNSSVTTANLILDKELESGGRYFVNVTAVNGVGLETTVTSEGVIVDNSPPVCLQVWDGKDDARQDLQYASSSSKLSISWVCVDKESPIIHYRFSVKNLRTQEYIIPFHALRTPLNSTGSAIITGGGQIASKYEEGEIYAVGIEVINAVGLSSVNWTDGVIIDSSPPRVNNLQLAYDPNKNSLEASWTVKDEQSGIESVAWGLGTNPEYNDVTNLTIISSSQTSISISDIPLSLGRTYFLSLFVLNKAGLHSTSVSRGVVVDPTAPNPGVVIAQYVFPSDFNQETNEVPASFIMVTWTGFTDLESGIRQTSWAVGEDLLALKSNSGDLYTEVNADDSVGGVVINNQTLVGNRTYFVCIRARNGAGLQRTDCSSGLFIILGKFSAGIVNDGPVIAAKDVDFQLDDKVIWTHWSGFKDPVFGIHRYDWCIRDQPPDLSKSDLCKWPFIEVYHLKTSTNRFHNLTLEHGKKYYVTVRAENSRGERVSASSDGVIVDRTPPIGKSLQISPTTGKGTLYVNTPSAPVATWYMDDLESSISHFLVGVGSFQFQDDLLGFQRVHSLTRSIDLDLLNFTLYQGMVFHLTVIGVNMLGLKTTLTSQQLVVDWTPPESGVVMDGNLTSTDRQELLDTDYQNEKGTLSAHWEGFQDAESSIIEYKWCVGTMQGVCDLHNLTSSNLLTSVHLSMILKDGQRYFFTVEALNGAGLKQTAYSDGVTLDASPPNLGDVLVVSSSVNLCSEHDDSLCDIKQHGNLLLSFSWEAPSDEESGICSVEWCASSKAESCDIVSWSVVDKSITSIEHPLPRPLAPGTVGFIRLRATNCAGMVTTAISKPLLIDSTKPTVGAVIVGNTVKTKYLRKDDPITAEWSGFIDVDSGLSHFEWALCHAGTTKDCIIPFVDVGLKTSIKNSALDIKPGVSYVVVLRAHNKVGLYSEAVSNQFIFEITAPIAGTVYDGSSGGNDAALQISDSDVSATWSPFTDPNSRIVEYEMCVGTAQEKCDVSAFVSVGISRKGVITGLSLNHTGKYFVTVRATNEAGYSVVAASNGVEVDTTPPVAGEIRDGQTLEDIDFQAGGEFIYANWDEFQDLESKITRYIWCAGTRKGSCDIIPVTDVGDSTSVGQQIYPCLGTEIGVFITVGAYNGAGAVTRVTSNGFEVDGTPPVISKVVDLQGGPPFVDKDYISAIDAYCVRWETEDAKSPVLKSEVSICSAIDLNNCLLNNMDVENRTEICFADLELQEGAKYVTTIRSTNTVGRASELSSDGFVVDSTPPLVGDIMHIENPPVGESQEVFTNSEISVKWSGFSDMESEVEKYFVCVGTKPGECNITSLTDLGNATSYILQDQGLAQGETYFVSIKAKNIAGLVSDFVSSSGVTVDMTGPTSEGQILDGEKEDEDIDFQKRRTFLTAHWNEFEDLESDVISLSWCAGLSPGSCNLVQKTELTPSSTSTRKVLNKPLKNGERYYVTVNAVNGAGVQTTYTSDGVTVDETPPTSGIVIYGEGRDSRYVNGEQDIHAHWINFEDLESGIDSYEIALCDARNVSFCPQSFTGVGKATNVSITGLDLESGGQYFVIVRAINFAGLHAQASSDRFTVDFTSPLAGEARIGTALEPTKYQSDLTNLIVRWDNFSDPESRISEYKVCVTTMPGNCTVTKYIDVGMDVNFTFHDLHLLHGELYYVVVKGTNPIGMSSETTTNPILIDSTPPVLKYPDTFIINTTVENPTEDISVHEGLQGSDHVRFKCSEELLTADWDEFEDPESQLERYDWCVGTSQARCDVLALRSVEKRSHGADITRRIPSGTILFTTVYAINGVGLKVRLVSEQCEVISVAPKAVEVIDIPTSNRTTLSDIDWKSMAQSLSLRWEIFGGYVGDISRFHIQVAITQPSSNLSLPQIDSEKSWRSEPLVHDFMDVLASEKNVTLQGVALEPWERYREVVRIWNEGGIYSDSASDGLRIEPAAPPERGLFILDKAAEQEPLRWLPGIRLPPVNDSALDSEIKYISSPGEVELIVRSGLNDSSDRTAFILDHNLFSPTKEFKITVERVTSDANETNTTENFRVMKVYPGFADPDGPCCARRPLNPQSVFSDTHFKTTMPSQHFGLSIVRLLNDHFAVGSSNKAFILPLRNRAASHITLPDDITSPKETPILVSSHGSRSVFLASGIAYVYRSEVSDVGNLELKRIAILGNCKSVSTVLCAANNTWTDNVKHVMAINQNTVAITGINSTTNSSVVALFQERNGMWKLAQVLGKENSHNNFGHSLSLNKRFLAVATGEGMNSNISVYSIETFTLLMTIGISEHEKITSPFSLYLTESDALIMVSEKSKSVDVLQLNIISSSYKDVCDFQVAYNEHLSGHLDVVARDGGYIIALGMLTSEGRDGVRLLGFHGIFTDNKLTKCANLGRVIARESGLRVDNGIPRTTVSFINDTVLFGAPDVVAWPGQGEDSGTGRIYIATYCPIDHVRVRVSHIKDIGSVRCTPCEAGRKSFGGFAEMCSECEGMSCSTPQSDNPFSFKSKICDAVSCHSQSILNVSTNGLNFSFANGSFFVPGPENLYTVQLLETTRANLSTSSLSESFVIDPTSPDPGLVYDGLGSDPSTNCSDNSTFGEDSQCSTRDFKETDVDYTYNTREVHARWLDFLDEESDIVEYFWCVGTKPMTDDIRGCESTGLKPNGSHYGLNFGQGDTYYVTVIACNGARRCSAAHSDGVTIDTTPPVMKYVRDGIMGPDMDFQVFVDIIFAYFSASDPDSNVTSYEIAWGTAPGLTDVKEFEEVTNTTIWLAKFKDNALGVDNRYYATVRATNGAGLISEELSSNGIVVGKSEFVFDNATSAEFFFDTVNVKEDGTRKDGGVGKTYGTLTVPEGAVEEQVKLRSYSLDDKTMDTNKTEEGPVSNPTYTRPKQFMLGNYSFVIKALDPQNNTVKEGFQFAKPITIAMFYDVDNLVKANSEHVNNELTKEDIDPVLYLWDSKNASWFDAALTCPEPWSHVNKSINLLTVKVCHLTQFSFLWSFYAQNGLVLFDKNNSMYNGDGVVEVTRSRRVTKLEFQLRRAKGSQGDITVQWSLYQNDSSDSMELLWPKSGQVSFTDGQWNHSFIINVDNNEEEVQQSVVWVQLDETTGGAVLASRDKTSAKILINGNEEQTGTWRWIVTGVFCGVLLIFVGVFVYSLRKRKQESQRTNHSRTEIELPSCGSMQRERGLAGEQMYSNDVDPLEPDPQTVSEMYDGDIGKPPVSPKRTHRAVSPLLCAPVMRLAWHLEQTSAQEQGNLNTCGKSVPHKGSDSKLQSTFGKKKRNKTRLTKRSSTTSKDKYCDGHELVLTPVSGDDEMESSSSSLKLVDMGLTNPLYESVLNYSEVSDADSVRREEKSNSKSEERKKIYMRTERSRTEIELPQLAGKKMYSSDVHPPEPDPETVSEMYGGDLRRPSVSPNKTHRAVSPLSCTSETRLAWHPQQTSAQEQGKLSTSGESVPREGSDSKLRSTFGKEKKRRSTTSKDKYYDGHELVLTPVSGDDEMESSSSSLKLVDMRLTNPLYESVLNCSPEVSDADSLRREEKGNSKFEERKKIYMRTTKGNRVDSQDGYAFK